MADAIKIAFAECPDFPYLPELPDRGPYAELIGRSTAFLAGLSVDLHAAGWRLTDASVVIIGWQSARSGPISICSRSLPRATPDRSRSRSPDPGPWPRISNAREATAPSPIRVPAATLASRSPRASVR